MTTEQSHPEFLPWYAAGTLEPERVAEVERHLEGCAECREELEQLRSMSETLPRATLEAIPEPNPWRTAFWGAAAASVVFAALGLAALRPSAPDRPVVEQVPAVLLVPQSRDPVAAPEVRGGGPWLFSILLPVSAEGGEHRLIVSRSDRPVPAGELIVTPDGDGRVSVVIRELAGPGRYSLTLQAVDGGKEHDYGFEILP